jgi:transcriptional regulator with XRE-family HTH domain
MTQSGASDDRWQLEQTLRIGAAIRALRGRRSAAQISDVTAELGQRVGRSTITDIEIGRRRYVAVHELCLIAAALGVSPAALLVHSEMPEGRVEFLPDRTAPAHEVADWLGGGRPAPLHVTGPDLPEPDRKVNIQFATAARWQRLRNTQLRMALDPDADPELLAQIREQLASAERAVRAVGGVINGGDGDAAG